MEILLSINDLNIYKSNNLILGASKKLKKELNNEFTKLNINVINDDFTFSTDLVKNELENHGINFYGFKNLEKIVGKKISELSIEESYYLKIILKVFKADKYIVIDNFLTYLNKSMKEDILNFVTENKISIISYSQTIEDDYFFDGYITACLEDKVAISGPAKIVLKEDKIIKRLGYKLPFSVDLSNQLRLFNLVDKTCFNIDELVGELWK